MSSPTLEELEKALVDETAPIAKRTRCVFYLKHMGGKAAIDALTKGITNARSGKFLAPFVEPLCSGTRQTGLKSSSVLLTHEIAFVLGTFASDP